MITMATDNKDKVLNVPNLRFPEFTEEWKTVFIGDILNIGNGKDYKLLNPGCIPVFGTGGYMLSVDNFLYDGESVLIGRKGTINKPFYYSGKFWTVDTLFYTHSFNEVLPKFVYGLFQNINWDLYNEASGVPSLSKSTIEKIRCNIPTIKEQSKIAKLLFLLDRRIETQNKIIEKLESLIKGICNKLLFADNGKPVRLIDILTERTEKTKENNQHEVLSSTVKGIFSQREYFSKDIASENNIGYKIIRLYDIVLSPQNLWMGNINYNEKFKIGIVSPSYKIFSIKAEFDKRFVAFMLKTHRALYNYMLVSEQGASVVRRNLNMEAFEQLVFKMPLYDKQREIGKTLSFLQSRLELETEIKSDYEQQKKYLLTEMFI